ncbi:hypothetical protein ART_1747 [Arthrobacter sp. PAMC 25486]|nr:hypothetical protein ART_1747 [Arthrobacter sp. PAMC 25486]
MPATDQPQRPALASSMTAAEFSRWYWLKTELADFARSQGLSASGGKEQITERISAMLDGRLQPSLPAEKRSTKQLAGPLTVDTTVPKGQRCSQLLRAWFTEQLGPGFHFDAHMRDFFAAGDGTATLADALTHWHETRNAAVPEIGRQFELNQFTRTWFAEHPAGTREQMHAAWQVHRSLPVDLRP